MTPSPSPSPSPSAGGAAQVVRALDALRPGALSSFLRRQRWFAAARPGNGDAARVVDLAVVPWGSGAFAMARVAEREDAESDIYQVPVAARPFAPDGVPDTAVMGTVDLTDARLTLYDAVYDAEFRAGMEAALASGCAVTLAAGSRWVIEPIAVGAGGQSAAPARDSRVVSAEQSNTSIVFADELILKLFRRLVPGPHPDVEVTRFLTTHAAFAGTPALRAELRFEDGETRTTAGLAQVYLPDATDAWADALERGRPYVAAPAAGEPRNAFLDDATRLGHTTRAMHDALAAGGDPDFDPEPAAPEDLDRWTHRTQQMIRTSLALLERRLAEPGFPRDHMAEAQALVRRLDHYIGWVDEINDTADDDLGERLRIHGDLHLGQVLRRRDGAFLIIDFEGEPSRSAAERREKASPLRDVAGMLRSFGYAAATLVSAAAGAPPHLRELRVGRWERDARAAFLAGYLEDTGGPRFLPDEESHTRALLTLFETEKAFYELAYELKHRPAWVWIPMRGIAKLFVT